MNDLRSILHVTVNDPHRHKILLIKLAHLESQGYRKLAKYKKTHHVTDSRFLKHIADEARHAHFLSNLAKQLGPDEKIDFQTKHYLTKLEVFIIKQIRLRGMSATKELPYILMTYVIEKRAEELYPLYENMLRELANPFSIQPIIDDELEHLNQMDHELKETNLPSDLLNECVWFERELFNDFLKSFISAGHFLRFSTA